METRLGSRLREFTRRRPTVEVCELCSAPLAAEHEHLVELAARQLVCACQACALLFGHQAGGSYRRVPRRVRQLPDFRLGEVQWAGLGIPIGLAFFFHSTPAERVVAVYPSPAGPTESQLPLDAWGDLVADNEVLRSLEPDVEALLVNRVYGKQQHLLVPIDACYKLVGLIRLHWHGLWGGSEARRQIETFFAELNQRAE